MSAGVRQYAEILLEQNAGLDHRQRAQIGRDACVSRKRGEIGTIACLNRMWAMMRASVHRQAGCLPEHIVRLSSYSRMAVMSAGVHR